MEIDLFIPGIPQPGGSKRHIGDGRVIDSNPKVLSWRGAVAQCISDHYTDAPITDAIHLCMQFYMPRPKCHYGTGRNRGILKASAPAHHTKKPDALKLGRAVEDALTGVLWRDDAQIVIESIKKRYCDYLHPQPGVHIVCGQLGE